MMKESGTTHAKKKGRDRPPGGELLRLIILMLLIETSLLHFVAAETSGAELRPPLLAFTVLFMVAAVAVPLAPRLGVMAAMLVSGVGLAVGGGRYLTAGGPPSMLAMFAIDVAVLALGLLWLRGNRAR